LADQLISPKDDLKLLLDKIKVETENILEEDRIAKNV